MQEPEDHLDSRVINLSEEERDSQVDVGSHFETDIWFPSRDELVAWARNVGKGLGFAVTIRSSDKLEGGRARPRVILGCDRGGFYRENQYKKGRVKQNLRKTTSKRCGCPFSLIGQRDALCNEWKIEVKCGMHNHGNMHLESHAFVGRLDSEERKIVQDMFASGVKPRKILSALKNRNPANTTGMRTIYNERVKMQKELDGGTPIQFLYKCITDSGYVRFNRVNEDTKHLESLFFAHPTAIQLSKMFSSVFLLDCTYKKNRYRFPLLSIVGVTSTQQIFFSAFIFMFDETEQSYMWALEHFKRILDQTSLPNVFVTDIELSLLSAIKVIFPHAQYILCQVHVHRNILANCKKHFKEGKDCEVFLSVWQHMINARTENEFNIRYNAMLTEYSITYPEVCTYVSSTWIEPYKEHFVCAWIDKYLHLGNSTINRVESGHCHLKKFLEVSFTNLTTIWRDFDQMINLQHTEIRRSFGHSIIQVSEEFTNSLYSNLLGHVSLNALYMIKEEENYSKTRYIEAEECTHTNRITLGLPCAHDLTSYISQLKAYPLWLVHKHWTHLNLPEMDIDYKAQPEDEVAIEKHDIDIEMKGFLQRYLNTSEHQELEINKKLCEIMEPTSSQTIKPLMPNKLKGRPNGSSKKFKNDFKSTKWDPLPFEGVMMDTPLMLRNLKKAARTVAMHKNKYFHGVCQQLPSNILEYLVDVFNVHGDGHCGFRAVSESMNMGDDWAQVRNDLSNELQHRELLYDDLFGSFKRKELIDSLDCLTIPAPLDKWMSMPDMGLVISSCYNVVVVQLSKLHGLTFLPLYSPVPPIQKIIFIGLMNENQIVGLCMSEGCPLPPIYSPWKQYHSLIAEPWEDIYASRLQN